MSPRPVLMFVFTFAFVTTPMFVLMLVLMTPTISPGLPGVTVGGVWPVWAVLPVARPINANLTTVIVAAPLTADQRGVFEGETSP